MSGLFNKIVRYVANLDSESKLLKPIKKASQNYILNDVISKLNDAYDKESWDEVDAECDILFKDDLDPSKLVTRVVSNINIVDTMVGGEISSLRIGELIEHEVKTPTKPKRKYNKKKVN